MRRFLLWEPRWLRRSGEALLRHRPGGVPGITLEEWFERDERRRSSQEVPLDGPWFDAAERPYQVNWLVTTGELYGTHTPFGSSPGPDPITGSVAPPGNSGPLMNPMVRPLGVVDGLDDLDRRCPGWTRQIGQLGGIDWLRAQLVASDTEAEWPSDNADWPSNEEL